MKGKQRISSLFFKFKQRTLSRYTLYILTQALKLIFKNNLPTQYNGIHLNQLYNIDIELQLKLFTLFYADDTIVLAETERELQSALER